MLYQPNVMQIDGLTMWLLRCSNRAIKKDTSLTGKHSKKSINEPKKNITHCMTKMPASIGEYGNLLIPLGNTLDRLHAQRVQRSVQLQTNTL